MPISVECPECENDTLVLGNGDPRCPCGFTEKPGRAADRYIETVLGMNRYVAAKDGDEWPVSVCPSCEIEWLVDRGDDGSEATTPRFICFGCGENWKEGDLQFCEDGNHWVEPFDGAICDDCFRDKVEDPAT